MSDSEYEDEAPSMKVYTKTGDKGTTCLYNMQRLPKSCDYFEALGHVDELNASIGIAREYCSTEANGLSDNLEDVSIAFTS
jgi:cob(I)alamin adenosyltransferase